MEISNFTLCLKKMRSSTRIIPIENTSENGLVGSARIDRVTFPKTGNWLHYKDKTVQTLAGAGFKTNYFDVETGEE